LFTLTRSNRHAHAHLLTVLFHSSRTISLYSGYFNVMRD